jgi:hypothetical protein
MSVGNGRQNIIILFWKKEAAQFNFWEYINGNQTFKLDSHRHFIFSTSTNFLKGTEYQKYFSGYIF